MNRNMAPMKNDSKVELVKRDDHYGLYDGSGQKIAATLDGCKYKLSKENCDEIFGVVDVGKLALEECNNTDPLRLDSQKYKQDPYFRIGYLKGYNKAMELNKDKLFTMEDVDKIFTCGKLYQDSKNKAYSFQNVLNKLRQPTEIEVEIVMETKQQLINGYKNQPDNVVGFIAEYKDVQVPMLDKDGCLILKKK